MTLVTDRPDRSGESMAEPSPASVPAPAPAYQVGTPYPRRPVSPALNLISSTVVLLSAAVFCLAAYVGVVSSLHHAREQRTAYADFRRELAQATAPVGPTRPDNPSRLLTPGTAVAVLSIPEIHLREVVFEGTAGSTLQKGPGHLRNTPLPGQAGTSSIMGRSLTYGGPFRGLARLSPGDTFTVTTGQGISTFRVLDLRRVGDPYPPPLAAGGGRLILTTADGPLLMPSGVLRVDADLISETMPTPRMPLTTRDLSPAERALGIDQFAWVPLVLWGQALVASAVLLAWARLHWGRWQVWTVAVPVLAYFGVAVADQLSRLLPNLM